MSGRPLTSYRVAKSYNMNVAKVYIEMKWLARLGLVRPTKGSRGAEYELCDDDLRRLSLKLVDRVVEYGDWRSDVSKGERLRAGLAVVPEILLTQPLEAYVSKPTRLPGELDNLVILAKSRFETKYRRRHGREFDRLQDR